MRREDALNALAGSWSFEMRGGKVLVQDSALLETIRKLEATDRRSAPQSSGRSFRDSYREQRELATAGAAH